MGQGCRISSHRRQVASLRTDFEIRYSPTIVSIHPVHYYINLTNAVDKMKNFDLNMSKGATSDVDIIPPPSFGLNDAPFNYV